MSLWVGDSIFLKDNLIWDNSDTSVTHLIGNGSRFHKDATIHHHITFEIDGTKGSDDLTPAISLCFYIVHKRAAERLEEIKVGVMGKDREVDITLLDVYIAVDISMCAIVSISMSIDINLPLLVIIVRFCVERTHISILKLKVLHLKFRLHL